MFGSDTNKMPRSCAARVSLALVRSYTYTDPERIIGSIAHCVEFVGSDGGQANLNALGVFAVLMVMP